MAEKFTNLGDNGLKIRLYDKRIPHNIKKCPKCTGRLVARWNSYCDAWYCIDCKNKFSDYEIASSLKETRIGNAVMASIDPKSVLDYLYYKKEGAEKLIILFPGYNYTSRQGISRSRLLRYADHYNTNLLIVASKFKMWDNCYQYCKTSINKMVLHLNYSFQDVIAMGFSNGGIMLNSWAGTVPCSANVLISGLVPTAFRIAGTMEWPKLMNQLNTQFIVADNLLDNGFTQANKSFNISIGPHIKNYHYIKADSNHVIHKCLPQLFQHFLNTRLLEKAENDLPKKTFSVF